MYRHDIPDLTYGQFLQRRNALLGRIKRLKEEYKRATDPRYTPLVDNPGQYALAELNRVEIQLGELIAEWEGINVNKGRKSCAQSATINLKKG